MPTPAQPAAPSSALEREVARYGDVSGYRGSRDAPAEAKADAHAARIVSTPVAVPAAPKAPQGQSSPGAARPPADDTLARKYTFTACVNGAPKKFDVLIARGPY